MNCPEASDSRWRRVGAPLAAQAVAADSAGVRQWRPAALAIHPDTMRDKIFNSALVWSVLMAYWLLADVLLTLYPPSPTGRQLPPDGATAPGGYVVLGLIGIWCAHRAGFPAAWDTRIPGSRRLLLPLLLGVVFGMLAIAIEEATRSLHILEAVLGPANVAFPSSVLTSTAGAIKWELLFLLLPLPLLLWVISCVVLRGRGQTPTFWILAALCAAMEPVLQGIPLLVLANGAIGPAAFAAYASHSYAFNFTAAVSFRRYGLLAPVLVRLGNYLVWHVLYGNFCSADVVTFFLAQARSRPQARSARRGSPWWSRIGGASVPQHRPVRRLPASRSGDAAAAKSASTLRRCCERVLARTRA